MPALVCAHLAQTRSLVSFEDNFTDFVSGQGDGSDLDKFTPNPSNRETNKPGDQKKQILFIDPAVPNCESLISATLQGVETVTISVIDANETPTDISLDGAGVAENCATGTVIGNLSVADSDAGDRLDAAG
jgi:hypothetical protein